jgi:hypothetical protein
MAEACLQPRPSSSLTPRSPTDLRCAKRLCLSPPLLAHPRCSLWHHHQPALSEGILLFLTRAHVLKWTRSGHNCDPGRNLTWPGAQAGARVGGGPQVRHPRQLHLCGAPSLARCYRNQEGLLFFHVPLTHLALASLCASRSRQPESPAPPCAFLCPASPVLLLVHQWDESIHRLFRWRGGHRSSRASHHAWRGQNSLLMQRVVAAAGRTGRAQLHRLLHRLQHGKLASPQAPLR